VYLIILSAQQLPRALRGNTTAILHSNVGVKAEFTDLAIGPAGFWKIIFSASGLADIISAPLEIAPGLPNILHIIVQPGEAYGGSIFNRQPVVAVLDSGKNIANTSGANLSVVPFLYLLQQGYSYGNLLQGSRLHLKNASAAAVQDGFAVFSSLSVDVVGSGYYFLFVMQTMDGNNITVTSSTFDVFPGAAAAFKVTVQPDNDCKPGFPLLQQPEVLLVDLGGNRANSSISVQVCKERSL
jgi:hypothetical protein